MTPKSNCRQYSNLIDAGHPAVVEKSPETGLFVGYVPGFPGAHSQGETLEELNENLKEVVQMLLEDGEPAISTEFIGIYTVQVA